MLRYRATGELAWCWRKLSSSAFTHPVDLCLRLSDHNGCLVPYFAADGIVTMDPLWREEERAIQGRRVFHHILNAPFNYPNTESLAQWKSNGKSLIAQKSAQVIAAGDVLMSITVAAMPKLSGGLMEMS